jgi:hypothetical protein
MISDAANSEIENTKIAAGLARGLTRFFSAMGQVSLAEFGLKNRRRADIMALDRTGVFTIVEIKSSRADFMTDLKWRDYLEFCDRFYFAVDQNFPTDLIPESCGLIIADAYGAATIRESVLARLHAARRQALSLRFARTAARRLMDLNDPGPHSL